MWRTIDGSLDATKWELIDAIIQFDEDNIKNGIRCFSFKDTLYAVNRKAQPLYQLLNNN